MDATPGEASMLWGVTRKYTFDPANSLIIDTYVRDVFVPLLRQAPGLVAYYWLDSGAGNGVSLSVFTDKAGADRSVEIAAEFIKTHLADLVGEPEVVEGRIAAHC
jgi:hypothetical protein